jgi:hypothetical protein
MLLALVDMGLILLISKKTFLILFICLVENSCSHQTTIASKPEVTKVTHFNMGPTKTSQSSPVFMDQTKEYGLEGVKAVHLYAVDVNHDGATDLVVLEDFYSVPKFYFFNKITKKFILSKNPFDEVVRASFLVFADFDHDGIYDVIVGSLNQKSEMTQYPLRIFKGELVKGELHYREMPSPINKILPISSVSLLDYNLDGELDLFVSNWFSFKGKNPIAVPDILLKGLGNFKFVDVSSLLKAEYDLNKSDNTFVNATPTFGSSICDVNQDGYPDIMTSNSNGYYNKLWLNTENSGNIEFKNFGKESGYAADNEGSEESRGGGNSFFSLCSDYNNDGLIDVVIGNLSHASDPEWVDRSSILTGSSKNNIPQFIRSDFYPEGVKNKWSQGDRRGVWIDYNLDGRSDLIIDNSGFPPDSRLTFFEQAKDHGFDDRSIDFGINILNPSGTVTLDLDGDGVMDFITGQTSLRTGENTNRIYVFKNLTKRNQRGSVRFHLQGKNSNTHGISSSVYLKTDKNKYFQNVQYSYGSLPSQNEEGVYFSYDHEIPQSLAIRWNSKVTDRLGREAPLFKQYNLRKFKLTGKHLEFNVCEDGRILERKNNCYKN